MCWLEEISCPTEHCNRKPFIVRYTSLLLCQLPSLLQEFLDSIKY